MFFHVLSYTPGTIKTAVLVNVERNGLLLESLVVTRDQLIPRKRHCRGWKGVWVLVSNASSIDDFMSRLEMNARAAGRRQRM